MEVLEYEVASTSASENLYSHDSSSGTDEVMFRDFFFMWTILFIQKKSFSFLFFYPIYDIPYLYDPILIYILRACVLVCTTKIIITTITSTIITNGIEFLI